MPTARRTARRLRGVGLVALACAAITPAAEAKLPATQNKLIVPGKSMGGVKLDMTKAAVNKRWGKGTCFAGGVSGACEYVARKEQYAGQYERAVVSYYENKVIGISIQAAYTQSTHKLVPGPLNKWKTDKGVHLGSKKAAVPRAYPKAQDNNAESPGYNLIIGSGRNLTVTEFVTPGYGASATLLGTITIRWDNCHFDPNTTC